MTWVSMTRQLGSSGPTVFPLALGCMGMSGIYGKSEDDESVATIHAALDQGVTLLDTGDFYGMGHNEILIGWGRHCPCDRCAQANSTSRIAGSASVRTFRGRHRAH